MSHNLSKTTQTELNGLTSRHSYQGGGPYEGDPGHSQNEPAGQEEIPTGVEFCVMGLLDMCRDHGHFTACQKQHRQNEPDFQVNISNRVEICVMGDSRHR